MTWTYRHGVWICNPFTIRLEVCPRWKLTYFELFDHTRFVRSFASLQDAQQRAESMQHAALKVAS